MKNILFVFLSVFFLIFLIIACKKEEKPEKEFAPPLPIPIVLEPFYAKIDGVEFEEIALSAGEYPDEIVVFSQNSLSRFIDIRLPVDIDPGTYSFTIPQTGFPSCVYFDSTSYYAAATGTGVLTIVEHNKGLNKVSGTFSLNVIPYSGTTGNLNYSITEGEFRVQY